MYFHSVSLYWVQKGNFVNLLNISSILYLYNITSMEEQENTQSDFHQDPKFTQEPIFLESPFKDELQLTRKKYTDELADKVKEMMSYRENRTYHLLVNERSDYFASMWQHLQRHLNAQSPYYQNDLLQVVSDRQEIVLTDILESRLEIQYPRAKAYEYEEELKNKKMNMLKEQSTQIQKKLNDINEDLNDIKQNHQTNQSRFKSFQINQTKIKQYEEFMKKQKKEKQERAKALEELKKKEEEVRNKKEQEEKELREKQIKEKKEQLAKKLKESEEKREKERLEREQRNKEYKFISKSMAQQPPLFKKIEQVYHHRYEKTENQRKKKAMSERHSMYQQHDQKSLEQHERKYEQVRNEREKQRQDRLQELQKMMQLQQGEMHAKYKSHYDFKTNYIDPKEQQRKLALEKKQKIKKYIEETVKDQYLPRIDEEKRKEFLKMIEDLNKKKLRKVKREDGSVEYEEVRVSDPRMIGLEYLEQTKEMAAKMRGKRKNSQQMLDNTSDKPKIFDYLAQRRKKGTSMSHRDKLGFVNKKGLSFDQKVKKVEFQSQKLEELAKQKQMKLKFGKFTTSQEILQHKQEIDQHYIDIINMKLKLINYKEKDE